MKDENLQSAAQTTELQTELFPFSEGYSIQQHFNERTGRFILTNADINGDKKAVWLNIKNASAASWLDSSKAQPERLDLSKPPFKTSADTACISYDRLNFLANYFEAIRCRLPSSAFNKANRASFGKIKSLSLDMTFALKQLESSTNDIRKICTALSHSIDTPIFNLRRKKSPSQLIDNEKLTAEGKELLEAFSHSVTIYDSLPRLTSFGTENSKRGSDEPDKRDAKLRYFMEKNRSNPLNGKKILNFVAHELKPLNIASSITWQCSGDPRTDSIDLLLEYDGCPVITEVKMEGDSFASVALVQLLYYSAVLASANQKDRLSRYFLNVDKSPPHLAVIVENRTIKTFHSDLTSVRNFLGLEATAKTLRQHFGGVFVLLIQENDNGFRVCDEGEYHIDWTKT